MVNLFHRICYPLASPKLIKSLAKTFVYCQVYHDGNHGSVGIGKFFNRYYISRYIQKYRWWTGFVVLILITYDSTGRLDTTKLGDLLSMVPAVFGVLLAVSSVCTRSITRQVTSVTGNLVCDWLSIVWAYSEQETKNGPRLDNVEYVLFI